jgi:SH3-like domain-containing protein
MNWLRLVFLFLAIASRAWAAESQPYFVSMKDGKTYMREGPGEEYPIKWVYHHKGLPVEVIASYEAWRRVRDMDGETGWVHMALLSRERTAVVTGNGEVAVYRGADGKSNLLAQARPGAIGRLLHCGALSCEVKFDAAAGWLSRSRVWGVHDGEQF